MRSNYQYGQISYEELLDKLLSDAEAEVEYNADLDRRAHKLSVKKEIERINHLELIQEQGIKIRQLQDSYDMVIGSKWWKLVSPLRKLYEKLQKLRGQKTMTEILEEINDQSRYERENYHLQRQDIWKNALKEFADGERNVLSVLTEEYAEGALYDVKVSVIIPTYNAGPDFRENLAALKGQKGIKEIEIIVVDSGSTDQTLTECELAGVSVLQIPNEDFTHSYARNLGAKKATGEYLLFMTQDAEPTDEGWLYRLLSVLINKDVVAVSPVETDNGKSDLKYKTDCFSHQKYLGLDKGDKLTGYSTDMDGHHVRRNAQLTDVTNLIKKDVFSQYHFEGDYAEDLRLGLSLIKDGYKLAQLTSVQVRHGHNRSAEYIKKRTYIDRVALCQLFPDMKQKALDKNQLIDSIKRGEQQLLQVVDNMDEAKAFRDNIIVYGRHLVHAIEKNNLKGERVIFWDFVKGYIQNSLVPYLAENMAFITVKTHEEVVDAVQKAYAFEVGTRIGDYEVEYGKDRDIMAFLGSDKV